MSPSAHESGSFSRTALVTGANRGIGLEVCRQLARRGLRVILTARDASAARIAATGLDSGGLMVRPETLDVADDASVAACVERLRRDQIHIDVLVNNAGILLTGTVLDTPLEVMRETMEVCFFGPLRLCQALVPAMLEVGYGRVVNVSSDFGSFASGLEGPASYSIAKASLNALTHKLGSELAAGDEADVKVNSCCPGWVRTRMGGAEAELGVVEGADTIVWLATLPADGPSGGFFRARQPMAW
jgi:NAD(P)-dependent dehydrogenase (short-subunit alcohol dehydrogenase family)